MNPGKVIKCTVTFRKLANKNENGEQVWLIEVITDEPNISGGVIPPVHIHFTQNENLDDVLKSATEIIAKQVDWGSLVEDSRPPFVKYCNTSSNDEVDINSKLVMDLRDIFPAAGIDISSLEFEVNGFDVTDEVNVEGDPYEYRIEWKPKIIVENTYLN